MKNKEFPYLKKFSRPRFQKVFKHILWHKDLTDAGKVFAFSLLTVPPQSDVKLKKLARKLQKDPAVISRLKKQLALKKVHIRDYTQQVEHGNIAKSNG